MNIDFGKGEVKAEFGAWTMLVYEQEFKSDLIGDVLGKVEIPRDDAEEETLVLSVDYRQTNWTACLRALWAGVKTADDSTPGFSIWAKEIGSIDMNAVAEAVVPEVLRNLFRAGVGDSK